MENASTQPSQSATPSRTLRNTLVSVVALAVVLGGTWQLTGSARKAEALTAKIPGVTGERTPAGRTFVGKVEGTNYLVSIVLGEDGVAVGYLCDNTADSWLRGTFDGTTLRLKGEGAEVTGMLSGDTFTGTATVKDGEGASFVANAAANFDGVYRQENGEGLTGWIIAGNEKRGFFKKRRGGSGGGTATPPPSAPTDPCAGMGAFPDSANNPTACQAAVCDGISKNFLTADTKKERDEAEFSAQLNNCTLDPFAVTEQP